MASPALRDRLAPGIQALFVGINPGMRSAALGHHFAGYSNRFWKLLYEAHLVPEPLGPEDDERLPEFGYGLTNLVARATPGIADLGPDEYEAGRRRLVAKVRRYRPRVVVLVGVTLYRALFSFKTRRPRLLDTGAAPPVPTNERTDPLGLRPETLGGVPVFVVPNPSGRNANYRHEEMRAAFEGLGRFLHVE